MNNQVTEPTPQQQPPRGGADTDVVGTSDQDMPWDAQHTQMSDQERALDQMDAEGNDKFIQNAKWIGVVVGTALMSSAARETTQRNAYKHIFGRRM